ncbi:MAG: endonuclease III [Candidatus Omnitrophica bacterium]|nr:endonuclease III [Candidatus Omnitrophota bacterium]
MKDVLRVINLIKKQSREFTVPSVTQISHSRDPYRVLISCILSLRTKDKTTIEASRRLFCVADNPADMAKLSLERIQNLIYPVGFFRNKAKTILEISRKINDVYEGKVPGDIKRLLEFKGVGRKTANLVLGLGFNIPAICVDTHVHRISNRLGWVKTKIPEETEAALERIVPKKLWIELNTILVTFGQNLCLPVSPWCSRCSVNKSCKKVGVRQFR